MNTQSKILSQGASLNLRKPEDFFALYKALEEDSENQSLEVIQRQYANKFLSHMDYILECIVDTLTDSEEGDEDKDEERTHLWTTIGKGILFLWDLERMGRNNPKNPFCVRQTKSLVFDEIQKCLDVLDNPEQWRYGNKDLTFQQEEMFLFEIMVRSNCTFIINEYKKYGVYVNPGEKYIVLEGEPTDYISVIYAAMSYYHEDMVKEAKTVEEKMFHKKLEKYYDNLF